MFNINGWELIVLVVLFLLVFGPEKLPETAIQAGKIVRELRRAADEATSDLTTELERAAREVREAESDLQEARKSADKAISDAARAGAGAAASRRKPTDHEAQGSAPADEEADRTGRSR